MSIPATTTFGALDPLLQFTTPAGLITPLNQVVQTTIDEDVTVYIKSNEVPDVDQQDLIWMRLDTDGRPLGTYTFFHGFWVRETPTVGSRIGFFSGDPTLYFDGEGTGLSGPGPVALDYWGWQLMNGLHGTPNLSNKFLVMGAMDNVDITGFSNGWRTDITGVPLGEGGSTEFTLTDETTFQRATDILTVGTWNATGGQAQETGGALYGIIGPDTFTTDLIDSQPGNPAPDPVTVVPPFYCIALMQWNGYDNPF